MSKLVITTELTHKAATKAAKRAGTDQSFPGFQDTVLEIIDRSRTRQEVTQQRARTWIGEMENNGYHVVDVEIAVTHLK